MHTFSWITTGLLLAAFFSLRTEWMPTPTPDEICDNALDDDGDGLIDLNDPDCECTIAEPVSLIPNPSFEEMNCCPNDRSQLYCADTWIQASEATTDYVHTCGWKGWNNLPVPLPLPDGNACVGFRNGRFGFDSNEPNWKEYTGACLTSPLRANTTYQIRFNIGFTNSINSPPTTVVFFGSTSCDNLPFGLGDPGYGCPTNGTGWVRLGSVSASGTNTWLTRDIVLNPQEDIYAIAIGPDCVELNATADIYYFFDNLILADQRTFQYHITQVNHPCSNNFTIQVPPNKNLSYQWYRNGIALVGETSEQLIAGKVEGEYQARIIGSDFCLLTKPYTHTIPVIHSTTYSTICPGDAFNFNGKKLYEAGTYVDTVKNSNNCDSIVTLELSMAVHKADSLSVKIFEGESYTVGHAKYKKPGHYTTPLETTYGCDSLVYLDLSLYEVYIPNAFSPNGDNINDVFNIHGGSDLEEVKDLHIYNRWGELVFGGKTSPSSESVSTGWNGKINNEPAPNGVYIFTATVRMDDGKERQLSGSFSLLR